MGGTILVVDDDRAVLRSLERILMADGYAVTCCSTAHGALDEIAANPPDAILLDLMMPAMNGREFLAALRNRLGRADIPVLVITGVRGIDVNQALSMGASGVIEKPFELDELLNKIALVLFRRHGIDGAAASTPGAPREGSAGDGDLVLLLSADAAFGARLDELCRARGERLVTLPRALDELPRVVAALTPRAVLLDLDLPSRSDGVHTSLDAERALEVLRHDPRLARLPILVLCADADAERRVAPLIDELLAQSLARPFSDDAIAAWLDAPTTSARDGSR